METIIFRVCGVFFRLIGILLFTGTIVTALHDLQQKAHHSKQVGLVSMLKINEQLVGKTK